MSQEKEVARYPPPKELLTTLHPSRSAAGASTGRAGEGGAARATPPHVNTRRLWHFLLFRYQTYLQNMNSQSSRPTLPSRCRSAAKIQQLLPQLPGSETKYVFHFKEDAPCGHRNSTKRKETTLAVLCLPLTGFATLSKSLARSVAPFPPLQKQRSFLPLYAVILASLCVH